MPALFGVADLERVLSVARQYPVFPCNPQKRPLVKRGFHAATKDPDQIRKWWREFPDALVGVPTGQTTGLVVLDYDPDKATSATHTWIAEHTDLLLGTRSHKTPRGGLHYVWKSADRYQTGTDIVLDGSPRKGLDLRGAGGYVIWWPAHNGDTNNAPIAAVPADLIDERRFNPRRDLAELPTTTPAEWRAERDRAREALTHLHPDGYEHWIRVGMALHHASGGSDEGFAAWHDWSARGETYDGIEDCRYHWQSFGGYQGRALGLGSVYAAAKAAGWNPSPQAVELPPLDAYADLEAGENVENPPISPASETDETSFARHAPALDWTELCDHEPPERKWLIPSWLTTGITICSGRGGYGKSYITQTISTSLATANHYLTDVPERKRVLIWSCEDDKNEIWRRQLKINAHFEITAQDIKDWLFISPRHDRANQLVVATHSGLHVTAAYETLQEDIERYQPDLLVIDNAAHVFGGNENDRSQVTAFGNYLAALTREPIAILLLAHPAKSVDSEWSGSTAWENVARMRWLLDKNKPGDLKDTTDEQREIESTSAIRYLSVRKSNYGPQLAARFDWIDGMFLPDTSLQAQLHRVAPHYRREAVRRIVMAGCRRLEDLNVRVTRSRNSPAYLPKVLIEMKLSEDAQRHELTTAMNDLLLEKELENVQIGKDRHGNAAYALKLKF